MTKDRHRIFEIYPSRDEAVCELIRNANNDLAVVETWSLKQLVVTGEAGITQIRYKGPAIMTQEVIAQVQDDLLQLASQLGGNSRVLIDFSGVEEFSSAGIQALILFNKKLQHRGSRMVLCCLDAHVRETFFQSS